MKRKSISIIASVVTWAFVTSCNKHTVLKTFTSKNEMKAVQFRIARPTNKLGEVVKFYQEALGLQILGKFEDHLGYDGVMLGMPDKTYHLEFTQHIDEAPLPKPTKENLLVFYYDRPDEYEKANARIQKIGVVPVEPENPYWIDKSKTYEDPDGWRIILYNGVYNP
ncbi:VOC family protein [Siphonobacter curvatus]|nr:VOC family protein [Siphonobacter curvatus]